MARLSPAFDLALLMALAAGTLAAQTLAMRHFDTRDGVPQSQVTTLMEDTRGFIWASTGDGLVRLGPNEAQVFDGSSGFMAKDVSELLEDPDGSVWVASEELGVFRIRGRAVSAFGPAQGLADTNVHSLALTRRGELYAGTQLGLFRRQAERFEPVALPEPWNAAPVTALTVDGEGRLWLGSRKGALACWDGTKLVATPLPPGTEASAILRLRTDPSGRTWALQSERLLWWDGGAWVVADLPGLPSTAVLGGLAFDRSGALLLTMGTDGVYLREPGGAVRILGARDLPCRDAVNCALRDHLGGLWLGTDGDHLWAQPFTGLSSLARDPDTGADLGLGAVTTFLEWQGRGILMGGSNGVFLWQEGAGLVRHWGRREGLASQDIWVVREDGRGGAWIGTMKGLYRMGPGGAISPGPAALAKVQCQAVARWGDRLWVGTDKGLAELDPDGRFLALHDPVDQVGFSAVHCLLAREEELLVGTSQGLMRFRNGHFEEAFPDDPARKLQILAVHLDARKRLWVGTSQGLHMRDLERGSWVSMTLEANGRRLYSITWIRSLASGIVAVGHAKGVTLVSPEGKVCQLTRRMGLLSDETNQDAALVDPQGRLWVGMLGGVNRLEPLRAFPEPLAPTPVVLDVAWERGTFFLPGRVTLPPGFAALSVHVDAGSPNTPFPVRYEVRFEDSRTPWHPLDPGHGTIFFEGLSPGTHPLRFRASMNGTAWVEAAPLILTIQPTWYQTLWARASLAVLAGLGCLAVIRLRIQRLKRQNQDLESRVRQRTRALEGSSRELAHQNRSLEWTHRQLKDTLESRMQMINTVSHDLRSPVTSILLGVDRILGAEPDLPPKVARLLGIMDQEARRLDVIVKGLLDRNRAESLADRLKLAPAHPSDILANLEDTLALKGEARGLRTHLQLDPASLGAELMLDVPAMQQVLFNLVENALKFTPSPGDVGVCSSLQDHNWKLEIWDTGRGIPREACQALFSPYAQGQEKDANQGWGLGLFICRSIVVAHGGTIEVDSDTGKGAIFKVLVPLAGAD